MVKIEVLGLLSGRLPTQESVRTCTLSKRWLKMWTCILSLYFDDEVPDRSNQVDGKEKFCEFVDTMLQHCGNSRIQNFTLICSQAKAAEWNFAELRRLYLRDLNEHLTFPICFFTCESLEEMRLLMPCTMNMSPVTTFNNLKLLFIIKRVMLVNENSQSSEELYFNFPVLEDFTMLCYVWKNVKVMKIESPRLSCFHMAWCRNENSHGRVECFQVKISCACLKRLKSWAGYFIENYSLLPRTSTVTHASLDHIVEINEFSQTVLFICSSAAFYRHC